MKSPKDKKAEAPKGSRSFSRRAAGEGERAAARGYGSQYDRAAGLIYAALMRDELVWIGVADPNAGIADDVVLGLADKVVGHQFKSSRDAKTFTVRSLLLGEDNLIGQLATAWSGLRAAHPGEAVEVHFVTDDIPSTSDRLGSGDQRGTSARFLRELKTEGPSRSLADWSKTEWHAVVASFAEHVDLEPDGFETFLQALRIVSGQEAGLLTGAALRRDAARIAEIATLLPGLVRDQSGSARWSREALLDRLGWSDAIGRRRPHQFPLGPHVQRNPATELDLKNAIDAASAGYVSLLGPPGSGKSTLLQLALHSTVGRAVARYLAFVPGGVQGIGRGEAEEFLRDIVQALYGTGLQRRSLHDATTAELAESLESLLKAAGERFAASGVKTVIVVDGLDHVPREERPQESFLRVLPLPAAMPDGVVFVLGSQTLELADLPPAVAVQAGTLGRQVSVRPLTRSAVSAMATEAGLDAAAMTSALLERGKGHPLATRYLITASQIALTAGDDLDWNALPEFGGEIEQLYASVWRHLDGREPIRQALRYVALSEKPLDPIILASLTTEETVEATFKAAGHLLKRDNQGRWSIFHNSFRLFVEAQPMLRFGRRNERGMEEMLRQLAGACSLAEEADPQRWLAFRYLFRAGDPGDALALAGLSAYRSQLREGRSASDIQDDIRLAFQALSHTHDHVRLAEFILARREIEERGSSLKSDGIISANLRLGRIDAAMDSIGDFTTLEAAVVDALVAADRDVEARELFDRLDPIDEVIAGTHTLRSADDPELTLWARTAHRFRGPEIVAATISHIRATPVPKDHPFEENWMGRLADDLALVSAQAQIGENPGLDSKVLARQLGLSDDTCGKLALAKARALQFGGDSAAAHLAIQQVAGKPMLNGDLRFATLVALQLGDEDLAHHFFASVDPPTLQAAEKHYDAASVAHLISQVAPHARIAARLEHIVTWEEPTGALYRSLQLHLVKLGKATGEAEAGRPPSPSLTARSLRSALLFLINARQVDFHKAYTIESAGQQIGKVLACLFNAYAGAVRELDEQFDRTSAENPGLAGWTSMQLGFLETRKNLRAVEAQRWLEVALSASRGRGTPNEELDHLGKFAAAFALLGMRFRAEELLTEIHDHSLGYSLPAKKDPQYEIWSTVFTKASEADPRRAAERIKFLTGLLNGMTETEGRDAADRVVPWVLKCAAKCCPSSTLSLADGFVRADQVVWTTLCDSILSAVVSACPDMAEIVGHAWARLVVPYQAGEAPHWRQDKTEVIERVISRLPADRIDPTVGMLTARIESEADWRIRLEFLEAVQAAHDARCVGTLVDLNSAVERWAVEAPPKDYTTGLESDSTLPDQLDEFEVLLSAGSEHNYRHSQHFIRLLHDVPLARLKISIRRCPELLEGRDLAILAERKMRSGDLESAQWLATQSEASGTQNTTWDPWLDGTKLRLHRVRVALEGEPARRRAFEAVCMDMGQGRESALSLLSSLEDVLALVSEEPNWPAVWGKFELYLGGFREQRSGPEIRDEEPNEAAYRRLLTGLVRRGFEMTAVELRRHSLLAVSKPEGRALARDFILASAADSSEGLLFATVLLTRMDGLDADPELRAIAGQLRQSDDFCVAVMASGAAQANGGAVDMGLRPLPPFYELDLAPTPKSSRLSPGQAPLGGDVLGLVESLFSRQIGFLERVTSVPASTLMRRTAQFAAEKVGGRSLAQLDKIGMELQQDLHLGLTHTRPTVELVFQALRRVAAELWHAGLVPPDAVDILMFESLGSWPWHLMEPSSRPREIPRSLPKGPVYGDAETAWLRGDAIVAAPLISIDGCQVLGEHSRFWSTGMSSRETIGVRLAALGQLDTSKPSELHDRLPVALGLSKPVPLYDAPSPHYLARLRGALQGESPDGYLIFCPIRARQLGWHLAEGHQARWLNAAGELMADTVWWRDGGPESHVSYDTRAYGEGFFVILTQAGRSRLLLEEKSIAVEQREWRRLKGEKFHDVAMAGTRRGIIK